MKCKTILMMVLLSLTSQLFAQDLYVGGDISLLQQYDDYGVSYYDQQGQPISDVLTYMKSEAVGWNAQRVRLFVDPNPALEYNDPAVCQDLAYVARLGKRIKDAGFSFMLDFHYSDVWADPAKQWTPMAWLSLNDTELQTKIYEYTRDCLTKLVEAGATPDFIQTGNEISYGMLWGEKGSGSNRCYTNSDDNWPRFIALLQQAGKACREVCPQAKIVIHTERNGQPDVLRGIYERLTSVDYDIIGLSYYPDYQGSLNQLETALKAVENKQYGKDMMVVEMGYSYKWRLGGQIYDYTGTYPYDEEGQRRLTADLITLLKKHDTVKGLFWWWPEDNGNKGVSNKWWNAALYDHDTGKPYAAFYELKAFADRGEAGLGGLLAPIDNSRWYTLTGIQLDTHPHRCGLYIHNGQKLLIR